MNAFGNTNRCRGGRVICGDMKRIFQLPALQPAVAWLVGSYLMMALRTTRWDVHGGGHLAPFAGGKVVIAAFWHERLTLMPMLWVKAQVMRPTKAANIHMLVSQHRDGRLIGSVLRRFGVKVIHGSSSGGAVTAMRRTMALLKDGQQVAITPDGPRGPRRVAASGVAQIAALSGAPVLPCSAQISRRRALRSWDRMVLPLPFGRGVLVCEPPILVPRHGWEASLPTIGTALTAAVERADRLCRA
jgi:lysophospholipid acyltransferase (LPLAT)-like uncharacterized protein